MVDGLLSVVEVCFLLQGILTVASQHAYAIRRRIVMEQNKGNPEHDCSVSRHLAGCYTDLRRDIRANAGRHLGIAITHNTFTLRLYLH